MLAAEAGAVDVAKSRLAKGSYLTGQVSRSASEGVTECDVKVKVGPPTVAPSLGRI